MESCEDGQALRRGTSQKIAFKENSGKLHTETLPEVIKLKCTFEDLQGSKVQLCSPTFNPEVSTQLLGYT